MTPQKLYQLMWGLTKFGLAYTSDPTSVGLHFQSYFKSAIVLVGVAAAKRREEEQSDDYQVLDFHVTTISIPIQSKSAATSSIDLPSDDSVRPK